ncbi:MAG: TDP-N-acetylfucosamine:lipid II N-acetylfucosaminyltransferase, partial [Flammeovirgaceae bacterium]
LYKAKLKFTQTAYQGQAFAKVDYILTWMAGEFEFAKKNIPTLRAEHIHFFYQKEFQYEDVDDKKPYHKVNALPLIIVGNSGTPANNHLDTIKLIASANEAARVILPVSYGEKRYIEFIKKKMASVSGRLEIEFLENFLSLQNFLDLLSSADALVINSLRPQGYGTIFLSQLKWVPLFLNHKNVSIPDILKMGIKFYDLGQLAKSISKGRFDLPQNIVNIKKYFSNQSSDSIYVEIFS